MNYEFWGSVLKYVGFAGAALVLISTVGTGLVNDKLDKVKDGKIDTLVKGNESLLNKLEEYKNQNEKKQHQIDELKGKAADAARGITSFIEFDGTVRQTSGGKSMATFGYEGSEYPNLVALATEGRWIELEADCSRVLMQSPTWLTPYFFRGLARLNLMKLDGADSDLNNVIESAGSTPQYAQAREWLAKVRQAKAANG